jgi:heme-degrading monooxygenase HmoA
MADKDPIVEEVWKSREQLLEQHGGLEGFLEHIKKQEQKHPERLVDPRSIKKAV